MTVVLRADPAPDDTSRTTRDDRVRTLIGRMSLREKVAQLYGIWVVASEDGRDMAPQQHELTGDIDLDELLPHGLGQLTRPFGSAPVDPATGLLSLARTQRRIMGEGRFGIPAIAHEECLAGFTAWGATAYPVPLAWGATFDPELIRAMAGRIGSSMSAVGIHQGLAPVLDVTRDARWGRTEETIGEDPYLVGSIASAYVAGLEGAGIVATLKHFVGYSASRGARNLAPVSVGPRERADVLLVPFEMAVREARPRSVMHSYADVDGLPPAADRELLTGLLRDTWGFDGTVVADYFGVSFLRLHHGVAGTWGEAAATALTAGVDVELPSLMTYAEPLVAEVEAGRLDESVVDRAVERVLAQKAELGMLEPDWSPLPPGWEDADLEDPEAVRGRLSLDTPDDRRLAARVAEESVILCANDGLLPLGTTPGRIALVGPCTEDPMAMLGCYSFPSHVGAHHPETPLGIRIDTLAEAVRAEFPHAEIAIEAGCGIDDEDSSGIPAAVDAARGADAVILALGDRAGLFGRGTSGEGCDAESLRLPGRQQELLEAVLDAKTPVAVVLLAGRPYALGSAPARAAAILQTFFPGEEGAGAIAGVLSGRVNPSGRLPVSVPARPDAPGCSYLGPTLAQASRVSNVDPTALYPFGHGLGYSSFAWSELCVENEEVPTDGTARVTLTIRNTSDRPGTEVVQVYLHDPVASVTRPVTRLIGFSRVELDAGRSARIEVAIPADVTSFTGRDGRRRVEPGELSLRFGDSSRDARLTADIRLTGEDRIVDHTRALHCTFRIFPEEPARH